jgi:hypothetical protein
MNVHFAVPGFLIVIWFVVLCAGIFGGALSAWRKATQE